MGWVENATPEVEAISQWPTIIAVCVLMSVLAVVVVCMRLWIRQKAHGLAADDYMAALSMVFALFYSGLCIAQTKYGLGLPIKLRPVANLIPYTRLNYGGRPIYQMGISFFKIALLISYLRLFKGTNERAYRRTVWITIVAIFIGHLGCSFSLIFACTPVEKSWNPSMPGSCLAPGPSFTAYAIVTIISDVVVAVLPIPVLLKLNVPLNKKIGLIVIFLLGLFTTLCSILRYLEIDRIQFGDGNSTMLILWGTIEFNVGNMVSSLPFLAPVLMRKAKEYRSKHSGGYGGSSDGGGRRGKASELYKLSSLSNRQGGFATSSATTKGGQSSSEENILKENNTIIKSVTYSVQVDDESVAEKGAAGQPKQNVTRLY